MAGYFPNLSWVLGGGYNGQKGTYQQKGGHNGSGTKGGSKGQKGYKGGVQDNVTPVEPCSATEIPSFGLLALKAEEYIDRWITLRAYLVSQIRKAEEWSLSAPLVEVLCLVDPDFSFAEIGWSADGTRLVSSKFAEVLISRFNCPADGGCWTCGLACGHTVECMRGARRAGRGTTPAREELTQSEVRSVRELLREREAGEERPRAKPRGFTWVDLDSDARATGSTLAYPLVALRQSLDSSGLADQTHGKPGLENGFSEKTDRPLSLVTRSSVMDLAKPLCYPAQLALLAWLGWLLAKRFNPPVCFVRMVQQDTEMESNSPPTPRLGRNAYVDCPPPGVGHNRLAAGWLAGIVGTPF